MYFFKIENRKMQQFKVLLMGSCIYTSDTCSLAKIRIFKNAERKNKNCNMYQCIGFLRISKNSFLPNTEKIVSFRC